MISAFFISYLLTRNACVEADLVDQLFNSSEKRLARLLLLMANFGKEGKPEPVIAKLSALFARPDEVLARGASCFTGLVRCDAEL
jgi:hypothetical protein